MISLQRLGPDDWHDWRAVRLEALREAPYAFSSTLAEWQGAGDTEPRWRNRLTNVPFNVIAQLDGEPAGQASGMARTDAGHVDLISVWVAPAARGQGVGDALVGAVVDWARSQSASAVVLGVRAANAAAIALYERNGFVRTGRDAGDCELEMARPLA